MSAMKVTNGVGLLDAIIFSPSICGILRMTSGVVQLSQQLGRSFYVSALAKEIQITFLYLFCICSKSGIKYK